MLRRPAGNAVLSCQRIPTFVTRTHSIESSLHLTNRELSPEHACDHSKAWMQREQHGGACNQSPQRSSSLAHSSPPRSLVAATITCCRCCVLRLHMHGSRASRKAQEDAWYLPGAQAGARPPRPEPPTTKHTLEALYAACSCSYRACKGAQSCKQGVGCRPVSGGHAETDGPAPSRDPFACPGRCRTLSARARSSYGAFCSAVSAFHSAPSSLAMSPMPAPGLASLTRCAGGREGSRQRP